MLIKVHALVGKILKFKPHLRPFTLLLMALFIFIVYSAFAQSSSFIKYLTRNEDMGSIEKSYPVPLQLGEIDCDALFDTVSKCWNCLTMKEKCPDCCLNALQTAVLCTPADNAAYNCGEMAFYGTDCPAVDQAPVAFACPGQIPTANHFQSAGCGSYFFTPNPTPPPANIINIVPGCPEHTSGALSCLAAPDQACIDNCVVYTNNFDTCKNSVSCCKQSVCTIGFDLACDIDACNLRIAPPAICLFATPVTCALLDKAAQDCLVSGACSACFVEVDPTFSYEFVAKSKEDFTFIWQMVSTPLSSPTDPTSFFTKIKVFNKSDMTTPVHESVSHQKSLDAAFSIFCATHIPSGKLKPGQSYVAKLYYLLPNIQGIVLRVDVDFVQMIYIRTRE